jgi:hypothetical protein
MGIRITELTLAIAHSPALHFSSPSKCLTTNDHTSAGRSDILGESIRSEDGVEMMESRLRDDESQYSTVSRFINTTFNVACPWCLDWYPAPLKGSMKDISSQTLLS